MAAPEMSSWWRERDYLPDGFEQVPTAGMTVDDDVAWITADAELAAGGSAAVRARSTAASGPRIAASLTAGDTGRGAALENGSQAD